jgi:hypothetical protein
MSADYFSLNCEQRRELFPDHSPATNERDSSVRMFADPADQIQSRAGSYLPKQSEHTMDSSLLMQQNFELKKKLIRMELESKRERALMLQQFEELRSKMQDIEQKEKFVNNTQAGLNELIQNLAHEKVVSSRFKIADKSELEFSAFKNPVSVDYDELQSSGRHHHPGIREAKSLIMSGKSQFDHESKLEDGRTSDQNYYSVREKPALIATKKIDCLVHESPRVEAKNIEADSSRNLQQGMCSMSYGEARRRSQNHFKPENIKIESKVHDQNENQDNSRLARKMLSATLKRMDSHERKRALYNLDLDSSDKKHNMLVLDQSETTATVVKHSMQSEGWKFKQTAAVNKIPIVPNHLKLSLGASNDFDIIHRNRIPESPDTFRAKESESSNFKKLEVGLSPKQPSLGPLGLTPLNLSRVLSLGPQKDYLPQTPEMNSILKHGLGMLPNHVSDRKNRSSILQSSQDQNKSICNDSMLNARGLNTSNQRIFYHGIDTENSRIANKSKKERSHMSQMVDEYDQRELQTPKSVKGSDLSKKEYNLLPAGSFLFKKLSSRTPRTQTQLCESTGSSGVLLNISKINIDFSTGKIGIKMQPGDLLKKSQAEIQKTLTPKHGVGLNSSRILASKDVTLEFEPNNYSVKCKARVNNQLTSSNSRSQLVRPNGSTSRSKNASSECPKASDKQGASRIITVPVKFGDESNSSNYVKSVVRSSTERGGFSARGISSQRLNTCGGASSLVDEPTCNKGYLSTSRNRRNMGGGLELHNKSEQEEEGACSRTKSKPLASLLIQPPGLKRRRNSPLSGGAQTNRTMCETATFVGGGSNGSPVMHSDGMYAVAARR